VIKLSSKEIHIRPIGYVERLSLGEDDRDRSLVSRIVVESEFVKGLDGIDEWSHIYVIFWLNKISDKDKILIHPGGEGNVGIFATRAPVHPNPIGLTLVELLERRENILLVKGLDAFHGTPVLDIKPYPDWERGRLIVITDFKVPTWVAKTAK
jgi:tRNA-Thr(GGU) m(6)t(6)A37 methyltransferase TsaA